MSDELFDRYAVVRIYRAVTEQVANPDGGSRTNILSYVTTGNNAYPSKQADGSPGFRIKFDVKKVTGSLSSPGTIWIYNLNKDSRAKFETIDSRVVLEAGYGNSGKQVFKGQVLFGITTKEGPDYVTRVELGTGLYALQSGKIDVSYNAGVKKTQIVNTIVGNLTKNSNLGIGAIQDVPNDGLNQGFVISGNPLDKLKEFCNANGLYVYVHDEKVYVVGQESKRELPVPIFSENSGLVGIPQRRSDGGLSLRVLLAADLEVLQIFQIKSLFINGLLRISTIRHTGDTYGREWYTDLESTFPQTSGGGVT